VIRTTIRRSAKDRGCDGCWPQGGRSRIRKGDLYIEEVATPNHDDLGNLHWWRLAICAQCEEDNGRGRIPNPRPQER